MAMTFRVIARERNSPESSTPSDTFCQDKGRVTVAGKSDAEACGFRLARLPFLPEKSLH
jgi:hypothetical protein